jgi:hypothetical protein
MRVTLTVDGTCHELDIDSGRTLADMLELECGVSGCRVACADGTCGVCAVVVDGDEIRSCLMLAVQAAGAQVDTAGDPARGLSLRSIGRGPPGRRGPALSCAGGPTVEQSPKIVSISWGHMEVDGLEPGKDFKLYPGGGREWDWSETGTRHSPGIQPADVEELLAHGAQVVVLSRGMDLQLEIDPSTGDYLEERGVEVHIAETNEAVDLYNDLAETRPVGGLFHSTC